MYSAIYLIWGLLPLSLILLALWGMVKQVAKQRGREYTLDTLKQAFYCLVVLFIAIWLDQRYLKELIETYLAGDLASGVPRLLIYPALLFLGASIQQYLPKSKSSPGRNPRSRGSR